MTETVRIIAAVVDTRQLLMYKADGQTIVILQGDPRIRPLVDKVIPELQRLSDLKKEEPTTQVYVDLTLQEITDAPTFETSHVHYAQAQEKMGNVIKFFRMAMEELENLVAAMPNMSMPVVESTELTGSLDDLPTIKSLDVVNEIMAHAAPADSAKFTEGAKKPDTTIVGVMEDGTVIPGMEKLDLQLRRVASTLGNPEGISRFFMRLATVERGHTVSDLLNFMEKGELPIADDGSIMVYKRLKSTSEQGVYVDCHSGKVRQSVGSYVCMAESLVDDDRRTECSTGLHVARRDYLQSFNGDVCVLAKLAPEDVIAVPHGDPRKLRAKGYHIVAVLSEIDHRNVTHNKKLEDTNLLANAIAGNHPPIIQRVEITKALGQGVIYTDLAPEAEVITDDNITSKPLETEEDMVKENSTVDAREVAVKLCNPKRTQKEEAQHRLDLYNKNPDMTNCRQLVEFKRATKKSWEAIGIPDKMGKRLEKRLK